jgi:uncharacterized protein YceK
MKCLLLTSLLLLATSSCTTVHRHYYPENSKPQIDVDEAMQEHVNQMWGTTSLKPIRVRPIPKSVQNAARCEHGDNRYCRR